MHTVHNQALLDHRTRHRKSPCGDDVEGLLPWVEQGKNLPWPLPTLVRLGSGARLRTCSLMVPEPIRPCGLDACPPGHWICPAGSGRWLRSGGCCLRRYAEAGGGGRSGVPQELRFRGLSRGLHSVGMSCLLKLIWVFQALYYCYSHAHFIKFDVLGGLLCEVITNLYHSVCCTAPGADPGATV